MSKAQISKVTIAYHQDLEGMRGSYATDPNFGKIWQQMQEGQSSINIQLKMDIL